MSDQEQPQDHDAEASRLMKLLDQRLSGLVITHRRLTPAECLKLWGDPKRMDGLTSSSQTRR